MKKNTILILFLCILVTPTIYAHVEEYKLLRATYDVYINGQEYSDTLPVLNYEGHTYIPLTTFCKIVDAKTTWNHDAVMINVTNSKQSITNTTNESTLYGCNAVNHNGNMYLKRSDIVREYNVSFHDYRQNNLIEAKRKHPNPEVDSTLTVLLSETDIFYYPTPPTETTSPSQYIKLSTILEIIQPN